MLDCCGADEQDTGQARRAEAWNEGCAWPNSDLPDRAEVMEGQDSAAQRISRAPFSSTRCALPRKTAGKAIPMYGIPPDQSSGVIWREGSWRCELGLVLGYPVLRLYRRRQAGVGARDHARHYFRDRRCDASSCLSTSLWRVRRSGSPDTAAGGSEGDGPGQWGLDDVPSLPVASRLPVGRSSGGRLVCLRALWAPMGQSIGVVDAKGDFFQVCLEFRSGNRVLPAPPRSSRVLRRTTAHPRF